MEDCLVAGAKRNFPLASDQRKYKYHFTDRLGEALWAILM
jgi:hypothetical protein